MKKKIILVISCLFLLVPQKSHPGVDEYIEKVIYFFMMDISTTFAHEFGHAFLMALNAAKPKIYLGSAGKGIQCKNSDGKVNLVTYNPNIGFTKAFSPGRNRSKGMDAAVTTNGPFFGLLYSLILYKMFDVYKNSFTPAMYTSLRTYALVNAFGQIMYGFVPLCSFRSDCAKMYKHLGMSDKRYESVASKNLKALEQYAKLSIIISSIYKAVRRFHQMMGNVESLAGMKEFQEENAAMFTLYKISSFYAIRATSLRIMISTLKDIVKEDSIKRGRTKKEDYPAANPADWIVGTLVAPLII